MSWIWAPRVYWFSGEIEKCWIKRRIVTKLGENSPEFIDSLNWISNSFMRISAVSSVGSNDFNFNNGENQDFNRTNRWVETKNSNFLLSLSTINQFSYIFHKVRTIERHIFPTEESSPIWRIFHRESSINISFEYYFSMFHHLIKDKIRSSREKKKKTLQNKPWFSKKYSRIEKFLSIERTWTIIRRLFEIFLM